MTEYLTALGLIFLVFAIIGVLMVPCFVLLDYLVERIPNAYVGVTVFMVILIVYLFNIFYMANSIDYVRTFLESDFP